MPPNVNVTGGAPGAPGTSDPGRGTHPGTSKYGTGTMSAGLVNLSAGTLSGGAGTVLPANDPKNKKKPGSTPGGSKPGGSKPATGSSTAVGTPSASAYMKDVPVDTDNGGFTRNFPHGTAGGDDGGGETGQYRNSI